MSTNEERSPLVSSTDPIECPSKSSSPPPVTVMPSSSGDPMEMEDELKKEYLGEPMDISITAEDASNILDASRSFNEALESLIAQEKRSKLARSPKRSKIKNFQSPTNMSNVKSDNKTSSDKSTCFQPDTDFAEQKGNESTDTIKHNEENDTNEKSGADKCTTRSSNKEDNDVDKTKSSSTHLYHHLFDHAAKTCKHPLVQSFLSFIKESNFSNEEIQISLLLFVDMNKSSKLMSAFDIIATSVTTSTNAVKSENTHFSNEDDVDRETKDTDDDYNDVIENRMKRKRKLNLDMSDAPQENTEASLEEDGKNQTSNIDNQDIKNQSPPKIDNIKSPELPLQQEDLLLDPELINSDEVLRPNDAVTPITMIKAEKLLKYNDLVSLFMCFLTSISCCTQNKSESLVRTNLSCTTTTSTPPASTKQDHSTPKQQPTMTPPSTVSPAASPNPDSESNHNLQSLCNISAQKGKEIRDFANYATRQLLKFTHDANNNQNKMGETEDEKINLSSCYEDTEVSFENFGDWYNSGGFELMPWLELLDLAKWESLGQQSTDIQPQQVLSNEDPDHVLSHTKGLSPQSSESYRGETNQNPTQCDDTKKCNLSPHGNAKPLSPKSTKLTKVQSSSSVASNIIPPSQVSSTSNSTTAVRKNGKKSTKTPSPPKRNLSENKIKATIHQTRRITSSETSDMTRQISSFERTGEKRKISPTHHYSRERKRSPTQASISPPDQSRHITNSQAISSRPLSSSSSQNFTPAHTMKHPHDSPMVNSALKAPSTSSSKGPPPVRIPSHTVSSRSIVSFDFTSSMPSYGNDSDQQPFCIDITEENLQMLKKLVTRTGLSSKSPIEVCDVLLRHSYHDQMDRASFVNCIREIFPAAMNPDQFHHTEQNTFSNLFTNFFSCFDREKKNVVNVRELAVGFTFLCDGNKSKKLAISFDLLDVSRRGYLSANGLSQYLRSYLTMLVGISYLSKNLPPHSEEERSYMDEKRANMTIAVDSGAHRTQGHVLKSVIGRNDNSNRMHHRSRMDENYVTFEEFAEWYTVGGYTVAPWLELLDLNKFLSLLDSNTKTNNYDSLATTAIGEPSTSPHSTNQYPSNKESPYKSTFNPNDHQSHPKFSPQLDPSDDRREKHNAFDSIDIYAFGDSPPASAGVPKPPKMSSPYQNETLFTFPLAHKDSLVVTREDAQYVYTVVDQLNLLSFEPEDVWLSLCNSVHNSSESRSRNSTHHMMIDQHTFIDAMEDLIKRSGKRQVMDKNVRFTLRSFHQSFDLRRERSVSLNLLMGGLTLLCGGRKSAKLSFAFGLFNSRNKNDYLYPEDRRLDSNKNDVSLDGQDLYAFFRSFLIVLFSCCAQSLDLSPEKVGRHISDTAQMVCKDVMKRQWQKRRLEQINFDDFGEWYNEGGYETAPWLELLDLNKWVLLPSLNFTASRSEQSKYSGKENENSNHQDPNPHHSCSRNDLNSSQLSRKNKQYNQFQDNSHIDSNRRNDSPRDTSRNHNLHNRENELPYHDSYHQDLNSSRSNRSSPPSYSDRHRSKSSMYKSKSSSQRSSDQNHPNALKFNLLTTNDHKGYIVSIAQQRVSQLRHLVVESGLYRMDIAIICDRILEKAVRSSDPANEGVMIFRKDVLDHVIRSMIDYCSKDEVMPPDLQRNMSDIFMLIFHAFLRDRRSTVDAYEFAVGFSIFCGGRKSDKLEYAFDLLDEDNDGKLSHRGMFKYLRSFLTVVMGLSVSSFGRTFGQGERLMTMDGEYERNASIADAIDAGAAWAADQVFMMDKSRSGGRNSHWRPEVSFDDFAEWYTRGGYSSIPWLELLDLKKWVLAQA